jgi:glycosyltransferase involved in cell wall biosynthesis
MVAQRRGFECAMKRVLLVAYHFPPLAGSSGIQRTLRFVQHLPAFGWEPIVLTAHPRAYEAVSDDLVPAVPAGVVVRRAFALDTARHLALAGRYPAALACPDRWMTWRYGAVRAGRALIRELRPDAVWSTYPIATAHQIGDALQARSGLPWVADFRDPMAQENYPEHPMIWRSFSAIEARTIAAARCSVFTTPGAARMYRERYPASAARIRVIENGYDEESFAGLGEEGAPRAPLNPGAVTLLHSGIVYPAERDPTHLFAALRRMEDSKVVSGDSFRIRFRASGHEVLLRELVARYRVDRLVEILPPIRYRSALEEMVRADGLLVLQASNCNEQIPAKLYEYMRAGRPIVALTDPGGDTAGALLQAGIDTIARLDAEEDIALLLAHFVDDLRALRARGPGSAAVAAASRRESARSLAALLNEVIG